MVLESIQKVAKYVVEFEPVFLYLFAKKSTLGRETTIRTMKTKIEKAKQRIKELDMLIERIYEDNVSGKVTDEWFMQLSHKYEVERMELKTKITSLDERINNLGTIQQNKDRFINVIRRFMEMQKL